MSSFFVDFEVLPEDAAGDASAQQALSHLKAQLDKPDSKLRSGDFARFATSASLDTGAGWDGGLGGSGAYAGAAEMGRQRLGTGSHFGEDPADMAPPPPPPMPQYMAETMYPPPAGSGTFGQAAYEVPAEASRPGGYSAAADPYAGGGVHSGLSNTDLLDRISSLERQLTRTAAGGAAPESSARPPSAFQGGGFGSDAGRIEALERQLREEQEAARAYRHKMEQSELKLKDREQLLVHAKEMWMKENVRASKLADALTSAEDKMADQERRLGEVAERYGETQREVRQLQHLVGGTAINGFVDPDKGTRTDHGLGGWDGKAASTAASLAPASAPPMRGTMAPSSAPATGATLGTTAFDSSFGRDAGGERVRPSSAQSLGPTADSRPLAVLPLDAETNADRFRRLCQINDAVLYEDELLQIGVKAEYSGKDGQLAVFFGNKSNASLQSFTVQYFVHEEHALRLAASPVSQQLEADKQTVQRVTVTCLEPFVEPPWLRVQYLLPDTTPRRIQMKFPVTLTKFMVGRELSPQDFFQRWRQQHFVLNEVTSIVHIAARLRGALMHVARSIVFGGNLRMHHSVDNNPDNFVLVGQLVDQPGAAQGPQGGDRSWDVFGRGGDHEHGLSLIRVEVGSGRFTGKARVVVRSSDHTVARSLCNAIVTQLSEPNAPSSDGAVAR